MELWRRVLLIICIGAGIGLAYFASLEPVIIVKPYAERRTSAAALPPSAPGGVLGTPLLAPEDRAVMERRRQPSVLRVEGRVWSDFFQEIQDAMEGREKKPEWTRRFPSGRYSMKALFFSAHEYPLNMVAGIAARKTGRLCLMNDDGGKPRYLEIDYRSYSDKDFRFGSGFSPYPKPPAYLLYPYRVAGFALILAGILIYALLPRPKAPPGALSYDRWRMVLSDLVGVAFFVLPLILSVLLVGGTLQVFPEGLFVLLLFSPFLLGGLLILWISAWYAGYRILSTDEGLAITTFRGTRLYRYGDMSFFQSVVFLPPRWLVAASWIAVVASAGTARLGAAGRALILTSSSPLSIGITLTNNTVLYINITDQMGSTALHGSERIAETLKKKGVRECAQVKTVRSIGLGTVGFSRV